ncbi:hypothetical protein L249_6744 [Ophiocordyceps polyrhachis-furcata BCC 54312]|uniref:Uncharacterized protein n=1 Tax=Ophiocordyceps polyrhachis-furcata BCC 54312 TaxID=1330021 RepID=A0A367LKW8_9HYPO|nr:hypothetical protein L249_6744 [Ophiocordyceps polyrhachis-furcata BCC 54312]
MAAAMRPNALPSRLLIKTNNNTNTTLDNNNNNNNNTDPRSFSPPPAYNRIIGSNVDLSRAVQLTTRVETSEDSDSDLESLSSITVHINTSVTVSGDNNTVCLTDTLDASAKANASALVKAMQDASPGQCGIPMIDEEGRPRPLNIHVDAGLTIAGAGNIIGDEASVVNISRRRRQEDSSDDDDDDDDQGVQARSPAKRLCCGQ